MACLPALTELPQAIRALLHPIGAAGPNPKPPPTMTKPRNPGPRAPRQITPELVRDMLTFIPPDVERETWVRAGMAIKSELPEAQAFELWNEWSARGATYDERSARDTWRSIKGGGATTIGTLFGIAKDHGYKLPAADAPVAPLTPEQAAAAQAQAEQAAQAERARRAADEARWRQRAEKAARDSCELWAEASEEGAADAPYPVRKGVGAHGVRVLAGGMLLVPLRDDAGQMLGLQRIAGAKRPAGWDSDKRFMPGQRKKGLFHLIGQIEGAAALLLAEGYATSASLHEATGLPVAMCVDAGNMPVVAEALRRRWPQVPMFACADNDSTTEARTGKNTGVQAACEAARAAGAQGAVAGVVIPEDLPEGKTDFNDLALHAGLDAVREQVSRAMAEPTIPKPRRNRATAAGARTTTGQDAQGETAAHAAPGHAAITAAPLSAGTDGGAGGGGACGDDGVGAAPGLCGGDGDASPSTQDCADDAFHLVPHDMGVSPADARCNRPGVWHYGRTADGERKRPVWICDPLWVSANTRDEADNGHGYLVEFKNRSGNVRAWAAPAALFGGDRHDWAVRLRDMGLRMDVSARARNLVGQYIDSRMPAAWVTSTSRTGWHGDTFVLPSRCIAPSAGAANGRRYVYQGDGALDDTFSRRGTLADWQRWVAAPCVGNTRMVFAVSCALAGPMVSLLGLKTGGFHVTGETSLGKTTVLLVAGSVWGRPESFKQQWRATDSGVESVAVQHSDGLLVLDEIGQADGRLVGETVYMLANQAEKIRGTRTLVPRRRRTWCLLFLSSGEHSLAEHIAQAGKKPQEGQLVRMPSVPADARKGLGMFEHLHGVAEGEGASKRFAEAITEASAAHYGAAGAAWLQWLADHMAAVRERGAELLRRMECEWVPDGASSQVWRVATRFALVGAAGELATEAGITGWQPGEAERGARACFDAWLADRGHAGNGVHAAMLRQVRAHLERNAAQFAWWHRALEDHAPQAPVRFGFKRFVDKNGKPLSVDASTDYLERRSASHSSELRDAQIDYFVLPEAWRSEVCKGFTPEAVAEVLRDRGHLVHERDRFTDRQRLPGMGGGRSVPCFHVKASIFADEL